MVGGLPLLPSGEPDILVLWLSLYPGDMSNRLEVMNAADLRGNIRHNNITDHEYVRFWGLILGARQFPEKGKILWSNFEEHIGLQIGPELQSANGTMAV